MGYWELQQERERRLKELLEVYRENWFKTFGTPEEDLWDARIA